MKSNIVRRSFALPRDLVDQVLALVSEDQRSNLNRLVTVSLQEFVARRRQEALEKSMAAMAADPDIQRESTRIMDEFAAAEADGLAGR
jgi:hypothetical protein